MLKPVAAKSSRGASGHFAIVASRYNARYVNALLRSAKLELTTAGADSIHIVRVPGAFEIPVVAAVLARSSQPRYAAILCLGVIFQGETSHARHIGIAVTHALAELQLHHGLPVIHGVYLFDNEIQARVRCLGRKHNRGLEVARTALAMARIMTNLRRTHRAATDPLPASLHFAAASPRAWGLPPNR
jgi:6,7-dimethyl-8-ribityllumazine synthase